jgi:alkylated DNA repair dioxygenase AlkB
MPTIPGIVYIDGFVADPAALLDWALGAVPWDDRIRARKTASYGVPYNYGGLSYTAQPFPEPLEAVRRAVVAQTGIDVNNCLLNLYPDGRSRMGFHADRTVDVVGGVSIVSVGAERPLRFRRTAQTDDRLDYLLASGSLLYMPQQVNLVWQHALPRSSKRDPRISFTFRQVDLSRSPDPGP